MKLRSHKVLWLVVLVMILGVTFVPISSSPRTAHASLGINCNNGSTGFTDVAEHYYACDAIRYLSTNPPANPAMIGYTDSAHCGASIPCQRPLDPVTRGQFSKIVALTFGLSYSCSPPNCVVDFSDVPFGSTFYFYIEGLYRAGYITGYVNPTCSSYGQLSPCFLPNNPVTRGQMAKIESNAAHYTDDTSSRLASYADVPQGSTFFTYIERLTMHVNNEPWPPDASQPSCNSSTRPCYYPNVGALRIDAAEHTYAAHAGPDGFGQVFPYRYGPWDAITAYVQTPDPGIVSGNWVATPVGLSLMRSYHFVESGSEKLCNPGCTISPYSSWGAYNSGDSHRDTTVLLTAGTAYTFRSDPDGSGVWKPVWCDSFSCHGILLTPNNDTPNLGTASLAYYAAGGETSSLDQHWGNIYIYNVAQHHYLGNWTSGNESCYDPVIVPWATGYGTMSTCSTGNWTVNY